MGIADGHIDHSVSPKVDCSSVVIPNATSYVVKDYQLTAWFGNVCRGVACCELAQAILPCFTRCVIDVYVAINLEVWVEGNPQKPPLATRDH